jgi:hypothetical protein
MTLRHLFEKNMNVESRHIALSASSQQSVRAASWRHEPPIKFAAFPRFLTRIADIYGR